MIDSQIEAILIKVAAIGLDVPHLGQSLSAIYPYLCKLV
jgi:diphthamide synthase (EF-2-diphthine--ammonia ligase)